MRSSLQIALHFQFPYFRWDLRLRDDAVNIFYASKINKINIT